MTLRVLSAIAIAVALVAPRAARAQTAVIVHPSTATSRLTLDEVRRIFLGKTLSLGSDRVQIVENVRLRKTFYQSLLALSEDEVHRRWVALVFRGEVGTMPREVGDVAEVRRFVAEHPGAIAFVDASAVDGSVKAITIDGHAPTDPGYPLR